jgi:hypothetical protein
MNDCITGLAIEDMAPRERLTVRTSNSRYDVIVVSPTTGDVLIRGGARFQHFTSGRVIGSSDGDCLMRRQIRVGSRVALSCDDGAFLTSCVEEIERLPETA